MAIDRAALTDYMAIEYDTLLAEAGIDGSDSPEDLGPALDAVETLTTLDDTLSPLWDQPLARYFTLKRIVNRLAVNMDVSISGDSYRLNQIFANAKSLLASAYGSVSWIVEPIVPRVGGPGTTTTITMPTQTGGEWKESPEW